MRTGGHLVELVVPLHLGTKDADLTRQRVTERHKWAWESLNAESAHRPPEKRKWKSNKAKTKRKDKRVSPSSTSYAQSALTTNGNNQWLYSIGNGPAWHFKRSHASSNCNSPFKFQYTLRRLCSLFTPFQPFISFSHSPKWTPDYVK